MSLVATTSGPGRSLPGAISRWGFWILACVLALGFHAAWFMTVAQRWRIPGEPTRAETAPRATYLPVPSGNHDGHRASDARVLWSPVLFSLPTRMGFSGTFVDREVQSRPSLAPPTRDSFVLGRDGLGAEPQAGSLPNEITGMVVATLTAPTATITESHPFANDAVQTNTLPQVVWSDDLGGWRPHAINVEENSVWYDEKPWEITAFVDVDEQGSVRHVFLEKPCDSAARNSAFVRLLKGLRLGEAIPARRGRVTIRYDGKRPTESNPAESSGT